MLFRKFYCLLMAKGDHKQDDRRRRIKAGVVARDGVCPTDEIRKNSGDPAEREKI